MNNPATPVPDRRRRNPDLPLLYPTGIAVGFILFMLDSTGVSPFAALRALLVTACGTFLVTWVLTVILRDRHTGALLTLVVILVGSVMSNGPLTAVGVMSGALLVAVVLRSRVRPVRIRWALISRGLTVFTAVMLLAIGIRSVQDGRLAAVGRDLYLEGPLRPTATAMVPVDAQHPDVYLILLDGYPRSDKLRSEFGVDNSAFIRGLEERGFAVADASRSNYMETQLTLLSMFGGGHVEATGSAIKDADIHAAINDATALQPFVASGYQTVSIPSDFEIVALRRVDRFLDTGQLNEFERFVIEKTFLPMVRAVAPGFLANQHGDRVVDSLDLAEALATAAGPARLAFVHIASPHSPVLFTSTGARVAETGAYNFYNDRQNATHLGEAEYARRLGDQVEFLDRRVMEIVDAVEQGGRPSVVVLFSDHGSGARFDAGRQLGGTSDLDLRSANLLAVRGIGDIGERSTLVNLLPEIANRLFGRQYTPAVEDIRVMQGSYATSVTIPRPD